MAFNAFTSARILGNIGDAASGKRIEPAHEQPPVRHDHSAAPAQFADMYRSIDEAFSEPKIGRAGILHGDTSHARPRMAPHRERQCNGEPRPNCSPLHAT